MRTTLMGVVLFSFVAFANPVFAAHPLSFQAVDVIDNDGVDLTTTAPVRMGAATLKRSRIGLTGRVMTNVDMAGFPYTVWIVIFNNPKACEGPFLLDADGNEITRCNGPDLGNPKVDGAVLNGSGAIAAQTDGSGGVLNIDFETYTGLVPEGQCCFGRLRWGKTLSAEVHIVVDKHPAIPPGDSYVVDLTTPFAGHRGAIFLPVAKKREGELE